MSEPLPILFTIPNFITAGSGRAMLNIVERLDRHKFAPAVCVMRQGGHLDEVVKELGIPFFELPFTIPACPYRSLPFRAWLAAQPFRRYGFRLWHSFHYADDYTEPLIARLAGTKAWIYTKKNMGWGSRAWYLRSYLAHGIAAQNTAMLKDFFDSMQAKVRHIPPSVDINRYRPQIPNQQLRHEWKFPNDSIVVAHVGNFVRVKNQPHLLHALARTSNKRIVLVLAGAFHDKVYVEEVRSLVEHLNLQDRVRFLGNVHQMPELLNSADIFAFCSHHEACPVAVLEAMACGLPCVVTSIAAMQDIHISEKTAVIVAQNDTNAFASALDRLAGNVDYRRELGTAARERIETFYTIDREVTDYEHLYSEVLAGCMRRQRTNG